MSKYFLPLRIIARRFHVARNYNGIFKYHREVEEGQKAVVVKQQQMFNELAQKANDKKTFHEAIDKYLEHQAVHRRGHVEFISAALEKMQEFGVERDLATYKKLLHLFPKGKMIPETIWQVEFLHYPKQQYCAMDLLTQMQENGICPDDETGDILAAIFGKKTHTFRKYQRMLYWMPKFKYASPYYVPFDLPESHIDLATMALQRMCPDLENKVTVFQTEELENAKEHTFIASAMSPAQQQLIQNHPTDKPIVVEGGFTTWLRTKSVVYFVLRGEVTGRYLRSVSQPVEKPAEEMFDWKLEEEPSDVVVPPGVHEQADGTVLAVAVTGSASKDSLVNWIKFLERTNPKLAQIPIVFLLRTPETGLEVITDSRRPTKLLSQ